MSIVWKVLVGLALALPLGAFVAGALASSADEPAPRETIVIQDAPARPDDRGMGDGRRNDEGRPEHQDDRADADAGDDDGDGDDGDDVEVVRPEPDTVDDDHSGPGGGGDDDGADDRGGDDTEGGGEGDSRDD